ncbi:DUF5681 domain-containing protein [Bradyrhizobium sp. RDM4]|uniref:DUF5681 domain-containing protein n=1 Tax=Bradyrhizobium sp. RDM4 TaxID=3378765 RepID=UPI0038FD2B88
MNRSLYEKLLHELERTVIIDLNGKKRRATRRDALVEQSIDRAIAGDPKLLKLLFDLAPQLATLQAEANAREQSTARERLRKKLELMEQRLAASFLKKGDN